MKLKYSISFLILLLLIALLSVELFCGKPRELPSMLLGEKLPEFQLKNLYTTQPMLTNKELRGKISLLNVWASWCEACVIEHSMLLKIKNIYHVPVYGLNYKDSTSDALAYLKMNGNPYASVGCDSNGDVAIDLGVYGTPETFVINAQGLIIYRHIGIIDQQVWDQELSRFFAQKMSDK